MRRFVAGALALAVIAVCGRPDEVVTARLVDPVQLAAWPDAPLYRVEVRRIRDVPAWVPDRLGRTLDRVDTIAGLRTPARAVTVGDAVVAGFEVSDSGTAGLFRYDERTGLLTRSPLPEWLSGVVFRPPPAFSPEARHLAYLVDLGDGTVQLVIRSWPVGAEVMRGPRVELALLPGQPGAIGWSSDEDFWTGFGVRGDSGRIWLRVRGRVGGAVRVDTLTGRPRVTPGREE